MRIVLLRKAEGASYRHCSNIKATLKLRLLLYCFAHMTFW